MTEKRQRQGIKMTKIRADKRQIQTQGLIKRQNNHTDGRKEAHMQRQIKNYLEIRMLHKVIFDVRNSL